MGLEHDGAARDQRRRHPARRQCNWKVERGGHGKRTISAQARPVAFLRRRLCRFDLMAGGAFDFRCIVADQVNRLVNLCHRFHLRFADLYQTCGKDMVCARP